MVQDYENLLKRISESSGVDADEINRRIEAKRAKLSGLISREGAAQIVAAELGISFDKEIVKINEILPGMRRIGTTVKIINLFPVREYNKNGRSGKVLNLIVADETGNTRCVLWDLNHISLFENGQITKGDVIEVSNASLRNSEIHLTAFSEIKKSETVIASVKTEVEVVEKKIVDLRPMDKVKLRAVIVQIFDPRTFEVCPECSTRVKPDVSGFNCEKHGKVMPITKVLINAVLDDGTETIRAVFFSDQVEKLGLSKNAEDYAEKREVLLGKESYFMGSVRQNKIFNTPELVISGVEEINLDELIVKLEARR